MQPDAIVVGAGLAGSFVAAELCRGGMEVLLLDAGPLLDPALFGTANPPRGGTWAWRASRVLGGQRTQVRSPFVTPQTCRLYVSDRDNPYETPRAPFLWLRGRQVGGRGHAWGRVVLRWSPREFSGEPHGRGEGPWPVEYEELSPYYADVERQLLAHGSDEGCEQVPDGCWSGRRSLGEREKEFLERVGLALKGRRAIPLRIAAYPPGPVSPMLEAALRTGRLTLRPNTVVRKVVLDSAGRRARGVDAEDRLTGAGLMLRSGRVFIAGSAIETVRLLLNSCSDRHPRGLGNSTGRLGRYLMDHPCTSMTWPLSGAPADARDLLRLGDSSGAYLPAPEGSEAGSGRFGVQVYVSEARISLRAFGEMRPRAENSVSLAGRRDRWGVPAARIAMTLDAEDRVLMDAQRKLLAEVARLDARARPGRWGRCPGGPVSHPAGSAAHECGGAPMGSSPDDSVVDRWNRVWDCPDVVVCDASCFRSSGYQNPSLTLLALALRAARGALVPHRE